ncbi:TPA: SAVED domain-containing protein [Listeria monocytogenes]|nr:SAVED domain-containing protein [Listeria monocytogenes]EAE6827260.1 SAVED domain-containing protein [Listeria monocytogenes]EAG0831198.1 SAVED domain-containing protein [Listeria monocytogenes]EAG2076384.1 SAVED domain-containing protein [Listeria monocytogenes]EBF5161205.1 SAVED domain-containing protein [Listeria monocytogenes]
MANSVSALKNGFIYQAFYFWKNALEMFEDNSNVESVSFELNEAKSFDDIVVEYKSEIFTSSRTIKKSFYQVKYHERNETAIKASDLMLPKFINATSKSFLQKAKDAIDTSEENIEVVLLSPWRVDQDDTLCKLISNDDGSFNLSKLKHGKTPQSEMGRVRSEWTEHLEITEEELFSILNRIKIKEGKTIPALIDDLNVNLVANKFKKIDEDKFRYTPYIALIDDLHAKIKEGVTLNKQEIIEHFSRLKMFTQITDNNFLKIGIRSFTDSNEHLQDNVDRFLDLSTYFLESRFCEYQVWNNQIKPEIQKFVFEQIEPTIKHSVCLEAHQSIAFTLGYFAHQKAQRYLYPIQKGINSEIWEYSKENMNIEKELDCKINSEEDSEFVIINVDLMNRNLNNDIRNYLKEEFPDAKVGVVDIYPKISEQRYVKDGNHCMKLALETSEILQNLSISMKRKQWWLVFTAPNSFLVFLGQLSTQFGEIQLMEYDSINFTYKKSILL